MSKRRVIIEMKDDGKGISMKKENLTSMEVMGILIDLMGGIYGELMKSMTKIIKPTVEETKKVLN